ncbi:MAG: NAD(P)/FAD-dependent oxidoreductase [Treponema sp.]|nr:NAD(P)/FAD-dependent oxidoreductase [Treponema sp.]
MSEINSRFDIAIIGTGPAGVSAAITSTVRAKKIALFGAMPTKTKLAVAHQINNYPGLYGVSGLQLAEAYEEHLSKLGINVIDSKVTNVYNMGDYFTILAGQEQYEASSVIIGTGVNFGKALVGEEQFLGRGVSYCATCDGMLFKGKDVVVIGYSKEEEKEADFLADIASKVYYVPQYKDEVHVDSRIEIVRGIPKEIKGAMKVQSVVIGDREISTACVFILRSSIAPSQLISGIKLDGNHIAVDRTMATSIPGCFAAGDIVGLPYQYVKAAGEGNIAALSAVAYVDKMKKAKAAKI